MTRRRRAIRTVLLWGCVTGLSTAHAAAQASRFTVSRYADIERVSSPRISPDGNHVVFTRSHVDLMHDTWTGMLWEMDADGSRQRELVKGSSAEWSPDGTRIAYLAEADGKAQLWVRYMDGDGGMIQVTRGEQSLITFRWAPDGRSIAFTMAVPDTSVWHVALPAPPAGAHWTAPPRVVDRLEYRADRAGFLDNTWTQLFVVPAEGGVARQVTHGAFDIGARSVGIPEPPALAWLPDGNTIVVDGNIAAHADQSFQVSTLYAVDVATGAMRPLIADSGFWHAPVVSPDGKWIAYTGFPRTGSMYRASDLYVMHPDGTGSRVLTTGFDRDPDAVTWADNSTIMFSAEDSGTVNTWTTAIDSKSPSVKPASNGTHVLALGSISAKGGIGVAIRSAPQQPGQVVRFTVKKPWDLQTLTHVNDAVLATLSLGDVEEIEYQSAPDIHVQGWLVKPPGFDPSRKYPLILEIHGGPTEMYSVAFNPSFQNFAANGFLVLYINPRGSTGYGSAFGNAIDKAYPGVDYDDLMAGVNEAIGRGWVDTTRMFVGGCSGGGVLSSWIIGHTKRFAAAAVRCPVTDWISFAGETDIPLFGAGLFAKPFWEDPAPWLKLSPVMYAATITTPTLIMTGDLDMRTPMPQSEELYAALRMRGVPTTLLRFAGEYHGTTSKPSNWMRTQRYMISWYNRYGPPR
ncbi:MAG: prolyl oligopeptidase family serine peptidase [Gemmatimonadales bacterium]